MKSVNTRKGAIDMDGKVYKYLATFCGREVSGICTDVLADDDCVDFVDVNTLDSYWFITKESDLVLEELDETESRKARETYVANYLADIMSEIIYNLGKGV